jgi:RNA polymerase sigma-70 factor (ECF subfamily)
MNTAPAKDEDESESRPSDRTRDEDLVARVLAGDELAFSQLYRRHAAYLARIAYRLFGEDSELDDTIQDAFIEILRSLRSLEDPSRVRAWMATITVRMVHRRIRGRQRRRRLVHAVDPVLPRASNPEDQADVDLLHDALSGIDPELRIYWVLHRIERHNLEEVAAICEVSRSTAKRRIARANKYIKRRTHGRI